MAQRKVIVGSRIGLHARPAALFVKAATEQPIRITEIRSRLTTSTPIRKDSQKKANCSAIFDVVPVQSRLCS